MTELTFPIETFELSSDCTCEYIDDETGEFVSGDCYGGCYDDQRAYVVEMLNDWATAIGFEDRDYARLAIHGTNMGWTRGAGTAMTNSVEALVDLLALDNADWRLVFKRDGNALTATRYSHDEPTGASFRILVAE